MPLRARAWPIDGGARGSGPPRKEAARARGPFSRDKASSARLSPRRTSPGSTTRAASVSARLSISRPPLRFLPRLRPPPPRVYTCCAHCVRVPASPRRAETQVPARRRSPRSSLHSWPAPARLPNYPRVGPMTKRRRFVSTVLRMGRPRGPGLVGLFGDGFDGMFYGDAVFSAVVRRVLGFSGKACGGLSID